MDSALCCGLARGRRFDCAKATGEAKQDKEDLARFRRYEAEFIAEQEAVGYIEPHDDNCSPAEAASIRKLLCPGGEISETMAVLCMVRFSRIQQRLRGILESLCDEGPTEENMAQAKEMVQKWRS